MDIEKIWEDVLASLKLNLPNIGFNIHIKPAVPVNMNNSVFTVSVPSTINKNIIEHRYVNFIESSLQKVTGSKLVLKVIVVDEEDENENNQKPQKADDRPVIEPIDTYGVNPKYTFSNFIVGSSNEFAYAAAHKAAEMPGLIYNPLFIYGHSGLGKTHLMHAIGNKIREIYDYEKIVYVSSERFTNEFIRAVREKTTEKFRNNYRDADVLLVDDIQFIEEKEATQEEFFHTFNELFNLNKQIVLTSDRKPSDLTKLTDRLKTRFGQGPIIDISMPDYETRIAILQSKALEHNREIPSEVLEYVAENIRSSIRELEGALLTVISMSEIKGREINKKFAEEIINSMLPNEEKIKITPQMIVQKVALYYNVTENDIMGTSRAKEFVVPRQISMYLCYKILHLKDGEIGKEFGKDRTTVTHNIDKIKAAVNANESINEDISCIFKDLKSLNG